METANGWFEAYISLLAAQDLIRQAGAGDLKDGSLFQRGEVVELRGSRFRIMDITRTRLSLRLLPQADAERPE